MMSANTSQVPGPDMPVTIKVNYEGTFRRIKLPLHDMVYPVLEEKIRDALAIPSEAPITFERYSDSAAVYVKLDGQRPSVYKQLYRAAKAKSKLKLRLTLNQPESTRPKPVSIEDETDTTTDEAPKSQTASSTATSLPLGLCRPVNATGACPTLFSGATTHRETNNLRVTSPSVGQSETRRDFEARVASMMAADFSKSVAGAKKEEQKPAPPSLDLAQLCLAPPPAPCPAAFQTSPGPSFAISCNSCESIIPKDHYHCSTCDDGDFDLCELCVLRGITCYSSDHWLIKRTMVNGEMVNSTTETIPPKKKTQIKTKIGDLEQGKPLASTSTATVQVRIPRPSVNKAQASCTRICNCCVMELPDKDFVTCTNCKDFDLCKSCFARSEHGHHPMHRFKAVCAGIELAPQVRVMMSPGRDQLHHAICDGCDQFIRGVRHKCLDCPDWDYCANCVVRAAEVHPNHRFAPLSEPIADASSTRQAVIHRGICCDGPLCTTVNDTAIYIRGTRYKCAVCNDVDFCAKCEASPANDHNQSHPLIKFKTPVRSVSVTTTGENQDGQSLPTMGDRAAALSVAEKSTSQPKVTQTSPVKKEGEAPVASPVAALVEPKTTQEPAHPEQDLRAVYLRDTIIDGTIMPPNHVFEQTWTLRNEGKTSWPAGCSVRFVGGDYLGHVVSTHPAGVSELASASESTTCHNALAPGEEFPFTVLLRTPPRPGHVTSYWRLTTRDGHKFGHRLWCDVNVRDLKTEVPAVNAFVKEAAKEEKSELEQSEMVFPKLDKESPMSSVHEAIRPAPTETEQSVNEEDFDEGMDGEDWDDSEDGFLTDEEYDILDASDEEFLEEQQKKIAKK